MNAPTILDDYFPELKQVFEGALTYFSPRLEQGWPDLVKLRWNAATIRVITGLLITVDPQRGNPGQYNVGLDCAGASGGRFADAWTYLNGIEAGALAAGRLR